MKNGECKMEKVRTSSTQTEREPVFQFYILHSQFRMNAATWPGPADALPLVMLHGIWDT
jgi:hypothetical protein